MSAKNMSAKNEARALIRGPRRNTEDCLERQAPYPPITARRSARGHKSHFTTQAVPRHSTYVSCVRITLALVLCGLGACGKSTAPETQVSAENTPVAVAPQLSPDTTHELEAGSPDFLPEGAPMQSSAQHSEPKASPLIASFLIETTRDLASVDPKALESGRELELPPLLLTADISKVPLRMVLSELGRKLALKVFVAEAVADAAITVKFEKLPLEEGVKRILQGQNYTLIRKSVREPIAVKGREGEVVIEGARLVIAEIRLLARNGQASKLKELVSKPNDAEVAALAEQALKGEKAEERLAALKGFVERADRSQLTATLTPALKDKDGKVRQLALDAIGDGIDPPMEAIAEVAVQDEKPELRIEAFDTLIAIHGAAAAIPTLEQATSDPDPVVRQHAENTLKMAEKLDQRAKAASQGVPE